MIAGALLFRHSRGRRPTRCLCVVHDLEINDAVMPATTASLPVRALEIEEVQTVRS